MHRQGTRTRSVTFPVSPGHPELSDLIGNVEVVASSCCTASPLLHQAVGRIRRMQLTETSIRVPLDVARTDMRSLQWRPLSLTEQVVSANLDLLLVLQTARSLQHLTRRQTPLLVDENIHYRCLRLLYSASASRYYVSRYLA
eukprot:EG_transcript_6996